LLTKENLFLQIFRTEPLDSVYPASLSTSLKSPSKHWRDCRGQNAGDDRIGLEDKHLVCLKQGLGTLEGDIWFENRKIC